MAAELARRPEAERWLPWVRVRGRTKPESWAKKLGRRTGTQRREPRRAKRVNSVMSERSSCQTKLALMKCSCSLCPIPQNLGAMLM